MKKSLFLIFVGGALMLSDVRIASAANCSPNPSGNETISSNCSFSGSVNGVDNGDLIVNAGVTLTINANQTIVFNPGKKVTVNGTVAMSASGAKLQQSYLWMPDADYDGTPTNTTQTAADTSPGSGYRLRSELSTIVSSDSSTGMSSSTLYGGIIGEGGSTGTIDDVFKGADDMPLVLYSGNSALIFIKCGNLACTSGNVSSTIVSINPNFARIATGTDGYPVIAIQDSTNGLRVVKCGNAACSSGNTTNTMDSHATSSQRISLTVGSDGFPIIGYNDQKATSSYQSLFYAKCGNASCSSGNFTKELAANATAHTGLGVTIKVGSDGNPIFAYINGSDNPTFLQCTSVTCASASTQTLSNILVQSNAITDMAVASSGTPIVAFIEHQLSNDIIRVSRCTNTNCSGVTENIIDNTLGITNTANRISIGIPADDNPVIAYQDITTAPNPFYITKCGNNSCSTVTASSTVSGGEYLSSDSSKMIIIDDFPFAAFSKSSGLAAPTIVKCGTASCQ